MEITTRPATEADLPALLALYRELHPDDPTIPDLTAHRTWQQIATQPGRTILVAELGSTVVGTMDCTVSANLTRGARPFLLLENVVVTVSARRTGVGSRLLQAVLDLARSQNCYKIQLLSRASRKPAHAFYEANGFRALAQGYRRYLDK